MYQYMGVGTHVHLDLWKGSGARVLAKGWELLGTSCVWPVSGGKLVTGLGGHRLGIWIHSPGVPLGCLSSPPGPSLFAKSSSMLMITSGRWEEIH
jgi:hypothetical protein